jgi:type I restriction enzyme S subunit
MHRNSIAAHKIGEVARVISGYAFKSTEFQATGVPVIKIRNVRLGEIDLSGSQFVDEKYLSLDEKYRVVPGDILLSLTGSHVNQPDSVVGRVARFPRRYGLALLNQRAGKVIVTKSDRCDSGYLYWVLFSEQTRRQIAALAHGAANQANVSPSQIESVLIPLPEIETQRSIASVLFAYDDLIENNMRRIRILEEMARSFYREWFVHFRFPGHETVKCIDSPLGKIPEAWDAKRVTEAVYINPRTHVIKETEKPHVPMDSLTTNSMLIGEVNMRTGNNGAKFRNGDTLFARITPCLENGKTAFVQFLPSDVDVAIGSTEFIVLRSRTLCPEYVYLMARSNEFRDNAIKSMSGATGRQRVQEECFNKFLIAQPDEATLTIFAERTGPIFRLINILAQKNKNLRRARDLLLPKLMSGDLTLEARHA